MTNQPPKFGDGLSIDEKRLVRLFRLLNDSQRAEVTRGMFTWLLKRFSAQEHRWPYSTKKDLEESLDAEFCRDDPHAQEGGVNLSYERLRMALPPHFIWELLDDGFHIVFGNGEVSEYLLSTSQADEAFAECFVEGVQQELEFARGWRESDEENLKDDIRDLAYCWRERLIENLEKRIATADDAEVYRRTRSDSAGSVDQT